MIVQRSGDSIDDVVRNRSVHLSGQVNEAGRKVVLLGFPGQIVRVDGDTVAAETASWIQRRIAECFRGCGIDDFPNIDSNPVGQQLQFINERDIYAAVNILQQLHKLSSASRGDSYDSIDDLAIQSLTCL